jgi:Zn-dependent protease
LIRASYSARTGGNGDFPDFVVFDGWGMIGWASAPYDPYWALRYPKRSALMAFSGPLTNLALVLLAFLGFAQESPQFLYAPDSIGFSQVTAAANAGVWIPVAKLLSIFFSLNLILCVFNLLLYRRLTAAVWYRSF